MIQKKSCFCKKIRANTGSSVGKAALGAQDRRPLGPQGPRAPGGNSVTQSTNPTAPLFTAPQTRPAPGGPPVRQGPGCRGHSASVSPPPRRSKPGRLQQSRGALGSQDPPVLGGRPHQGVQKGEDRRHSSFGDTRPCPHCAPPAHNIFLLCQTAEITENQEGSGIGENTP